MRAYGTKIPVTKFKIRWIPTDSQLTKFNWDKPVSSTVLLLVSPNWKTFSIIVPVYQSADPKLVSNYRLISLLSWPSKLLEKIVHTWRMQHSISNNLLSSAQFGFHAHSSMQEALISTTMA